MFISEQLCIVYFVDTSFFCKEYNVIEVSYFKKIRTHRHYSKNGAIWSDYEVKTEKTYPHIPALMMKIVVARLRDAVGR